MINFIMGIMAGALFTFVFLALLAVARHSEEQSEKQYREYLEQKRKEDNND